MTALTIGVSPGPSLLIPTTRRYEMDHTDEVDAKCLVSGLANTGRHGKNTKK